MLDIVGLIDGMGATIGTLAGSIFGALTIYGVNVAYGFVKTILMKQVNAVTQDIIEKKVMVGNFNSSMKDTISLKAKNRPLKRIAKKVARWKWMWTK